MMKKGKVLRVSAFFCFITIICLLFFACSSDNNQKEYTCRVENDGIIELYTLKVTDNVADLFISSKGTVVEFVGNITLENDGIYNIELKESRSDGIQIYQNLQNFYITLTGDFFSFYDKNSEKTDNAELTGGNSENGQNNEKIDTRTADPTPTGDTPTVPTEPSTPTDPTAPTDPTEPTVPTEPTTPIDPEDPTEPTEPTEPTDPTETNDPTEPTDPEDPSEPTDPTEPTEPTDPVDPTEPTDPVDPSEPTEPTEPTEPDVCLHTDTEVRDRVEATCLEGGYSGDIYCTACGELVTEGREVAALGHDYDKHKCKACGDICYDGTYVKENYRNALSDEYGDTYVSYSRDELKIADGAATLSYRTVVKTELALHYVIVTDGETWCDFDYEATEFNGVKLRDVTNADAMGYVKAYADEKWIGYETVTTDGDVTTTVTVIFGEDDLATETRETVTLTADIDFPTAFSTDGKKLTFETDTEPCVMILDFNDDTYDVAVDTLTVRYFVNGELYDEYVFPDKSGISDYLVGVSGLNIENWYVDSEMTTEFNNVTEASELALYAVKNFVTTFTFEGTEYSYAYGDYGEIKTFADVENTIFENKKIALEGEYTLVWKDGNTAISELVVPESATSLKKDRAYVLTVEHGAGCSKAELVFDGNTRVAYVPCDGKTLAEVLKDGFGISETSDNSTLVYEYLNYAYYYTQDGADEKKSTTEAVLTDGVLRVYKKYTGVTVKYVYYDKETTETVSAGEYAVEGNVFMPTDDGYVSLADGESTVLLGDTSFYTRKLEITAYVNSGFVTEEVCLERDETVTLSTGEMSGFEFVGWKYDGVQYTFVIGSMGELAESMNLAQTGVCEILCIYVKREVTALPTESADGSAATTKYVGSEDTVSDETIPSLSTANGYEYTETTAPTLLAEGEGKYANALYGEYVVPVAKLTETTVVYGGVTYTLTLDGTEYTLTVEGGSYTGTAEYNGGKLVLPVSGGISTAEYKYAVSVNSESAFTLAAIASKEDAATCGLSATAKTDGTYYGYDANKVYDISYYSENDGLGVFYDGNGEALNLTYSIDGGIFYDSANSVTYNVSAVSKTVVWCAKSSVGYALPTSAFSFTKVSNAKLYYADGTTLTLNGQTAVLNGTTYTAEYDEINQVYLLSVAGASSADGFLYSVANGTETLSEYRLVDGTVTALD